MGKKSEGRRGERGWGSKRKIERKEQEGEIVVVKAVIGLI